MRRLMRLWPWLLPPLFVVAAVFFLAQAAPPAPVENVAEATAAPIAAKAQPAIEPHAVRDVGGASVPPPAGANEPLERIAPRTPPKPEEPQGPPAPVADEGDRAFLLFQPVIERAGVLIAEGRTLTLRGITPVDPARMCDGAAGISWPCGMNARTALRQFVRGRAVTCHLVDQQAETAVTDCRVGGQDIAAWLVENGWAEAAPASTLDRLAETAQAMHRGLFGDGGG